MPSLGWSRKFVDLTGRRFGMLKVISRAKNQTTSGGNSCVTWITHCDCGTDKVVRATNLRSGHDTSCGCNMSRGQTPGLSLRNYILRNYQASASHRELSWELTDEQFDVLTRQNCHYCGIEPFTTLVKRGHRGSYTYNGIDRMNNAVGYVFSNVVSCCKPCNYAKGKMTYEEFLRWLNRVRQLARLSARAACLSH